MTPLANESQPAAGPQRIITDWRRFVCGLWRLKQGDISAAYCADIFPKLKVFVHEGRSYANCGNLFSGAIHMTASCYPLIPPDEYQGPSRVQYSYEGEEGLFKGKPFRLGPKVLFVSSDPKIGEWTQLFRVLYADGGMFASGVTYAEFLSDRLKPESVNERLAQAEELFLCHSMAMPKSQDEMCRLLEGECVVLPKQQLELAFWLPSFHDLCPALVALDPSYRKGRPCP